MGALLKTTDDHADFHDEILRYFDLADDVITAIENQQQVHVELQLTLIEPVVRQVQESADELSEAYLDFVENDEKVNKKITKRVESSVRNIFEAIVQFLEEVDKIPDELGNEQEQHMVKKAKYKQGKVLEKLLQQIDEIKRAEALDKLESHADRIPDFALIIQAVRDLGIHNLLVGKALEVIGLISNIEKVAPAVFGAKKRLINVQRKTFTEMLRQAQEHSQSQELQR